MRFSCKSCGATFQTASGAAPRLGFACPACGGEMAASAEVVELHSDRVPTRRYDLDELRARLELEKEESARARGAPRSAEQIWFAAVQGRQVGPLTSAGLQGLRARGQLSAATLVWREGWPAWVAAEAVAELRPVLGLAEEKPGRPFPVQPAAPTPPPLDSTYPAARALAGENTDPMGAWPPPPAREGAEAGAAPGGVAGDPIGPIAGDLTARARSGAMQPSLPFGLEGESTDPGGASRGARAPESAPPAADPDGSSLREGPPAAASGAAKAGAADTAADSPAGSAADRTANTSADTAAVTAAASASAADAVPVAAASVPSPQAASPAAPASGSPPPAEATAVASSEPVPPSSEAAAPGTHAPASAEAETPEPEPLAAGAASDPPPESSDAPHGSSRGRRRPLSKPPRPGGPVSDGGVRTIDLSGGDPADAPLPRPPGQQQWFSGSEEGSDFNPRNIGFAVAIAVVLLALALLVKAH